MDLPNAVLRSSMITLPTDQLRDRLNRIYQAVRGNSRTLAVWGRFDYLWDLKELAVLEGRNNVQVPDLWLEELERMYVELGDVSGRGH